jgi:hypothetical protein
MGKFFTKTTCGEFKSGEREKLGFKSLQNGREPQWRAETGGAHAANWQRC